jgi:hypothetical protein
VRGGSVGAAPCRVSSWATARVARPACEVGKLTGFTYVNERRSCAMPRLVMGNGTRGSSGVRGGKVDGVHVNAWVQKLS